MTSLDSIPRAAVIDAAQAAVIDAAQAAVDEAAPAAGADTPGGDWAICCSGGGIRSAAYDVVRD